jgi:hypothetical protein
MAVGKKQQRVPLVNTLISMSKPAHDSSEHTATNMETTDTAPKLRRSSFGADGP